MTLEEFQELVEETCYRPDGTLNTDHLKRLIQEHNLPPEIRYAAYGQVVYSPSNDLRRNTRGDDE